MAASIVTSISSNALHSAFNKNNKNVQDSLQKVGTGLRVTSAKDDAAAAAVASSMTSDLGSMEKAHLNSSQAMSLLKTMESGIDQLSSMTQRIQALITQSQSSTMSQKNKAIMQGEVSGLLTQMDKLVNTTNFNGVSVLSGTKTVTAYNPFTTSGTTPPTSNVFPTGLSYSFDNSVNPTAIEVTYEAGSSGCSEGTFYMINLETGISQEMSVKAPTVSGESNSYYFDQLGATVTLSSDFSATTFAYTANTATTPGTGEILANSSGDINCMGITTQNNNIAITETTGMINDISSETVTISGTYAKSATFTLPAYADATTGETQGDFVANNIDLSTTGVKDIVLTRNRVVDGEVETDSITLQINVITAFTNADVSSTASPSSITLSQLANIVIADSDETSSGTMTFQVNTNAIGSDSDNQFSVEIPSVSVSSLGMSDIDVTSSSDKLSQFSNKVRSALAYLDSQRATVGVAQGQIEIVQSNLDASMENTTAAISSMVDLDFAKGVLDLTNATVRMQASQQAMQRSNGIQNQLIQLLQG